MEYSTLDGGLNFCGPGVQGFGGLGYIEGLGRLSQDRFEYDYQDGRPSLDLGRLDCRRGGVGRSAPVGGDSVVAEGRRLG